MIRPAALALAALALGAGLAPRASAQEPLPPDALATVGSVVITRAQLEAEVARGLLSGPEEALELLVRTEVMRQGLVSVGFDPAQVPAAEVEAARRKLIELGRPEAEVRKLTPLELGLGIAFERWTESQLSEQVLRRRWDEERLKLMGRLRARVIVLRPGKGKEAAEALGRARELLRDLGPDPSEATFTEIARLRSDDPAAATTGGDVDWFRGDGRTALGELLPQAVVRSCFARGKPGLLAEPIIARDEVWLVRVSAVHIPTAVRFEDHADDVRMMVEDEVRRGAFDEWRLKFPVRWASDAPRRRRLVPGG